MRLSEKVDKKVEVHYIWTEVIIRQQRDVADKINDDSGVRRHPLQVSQWSQSASNIA